MSPNHSILPTHTPLIACQHSWFVLSTFIWFVYK
jgi:hypothetical protein